MSHPPAGMVAVERAELDTRLRVLAERQHSVVSWRQARSTGGSQVAVAGRSASTDWEPVTPRVLRLRGSVATFEQRCMAAALDAGRRAVISHHAAARLWRLPGFFDDRIHVSRPRGGTRRPTDLSVLHEPRALPPQHLTVIVAVPVTTVARTLFDLAGAVHPGRLERTLDNALARRLTTTATLHRVTAELAEHGRAGSTLMRTLLAERGAGYVAPESGLEGRFLGLLRSGGLPEPIRQHEVGGEHWVGRVDFAYPDARLLIEIDSAIHHSTKLDSDADRRRDGELADAGYRVLRITDDQVWFRSREAVAIVRQALASSAA